MNKRSEILETARGLISGARQAQYGPPSKNFAVIAGYWAHYLGVKIDAYDVAVMMTLLKIGRSQSGKRMDDHYVDACGYLAIAGEIATEGEKGE